MKLLVIVLQTLVTCLHLTTASTGKAISLPCLVYCIPVIIIALVIFQSHIFANVHQSLLHVMVQGVSFVNAIVF